MIQWDTSFSSGYRGGDLREKYAVSIRVYALGKGIKPKIYCYFNRGENDILKITKTNYMHVGVDGDRLYFDEDALKTDRRVNCKMTTNDKKWAYVTLGYAGTIFDSFLGEYDELRYDEEQQLYYVERS